MHGMVRRSDGKDLQAMLIFQKSIDEHCALSIEHRGKIGKIDEN